MNIAILSIHMAALCLAPSLVQAQIVERDTQHKFSISRPASWIIQERTSPASRVMLGIEGDGYGGNCNIVALSSQLTSKMTQVEVDATENKKPLGIDFFQKELLIVAPDLKVLSVAQTKRGTHFGHLVNYSHSYLSPTLQRRIYLRAELFSHSRPGKVLSFTCSTFALTQAEAQRAYAKERKAFEKLTSSLRVDA